MTDIGLAVPVVPLESTARAPMVWVPFATLVLSHASVYGAVVTGAPTAIPSTRNCTLETVAEPLADADADKLRPPETLAPAAGAVTDTTGGGVVSGTVPALNATSTQ